MKSFPLAVLLLVAATLNPQQITTFELPGGSVGILKFMNDKGQIAGLFTDANGDQHGFLRDADGKIVTFDVSIAGAVVDEIALFGMNAKGQIVGAATVSCIARPCTQYGFLRNTDGTIDTFLPTPSTMFTIPTGIDSRGDIVGAYDQTTFGMYQEFVRMADGTITTINIPNAFVVFPELITPNGQISGFYEDRQQVFHNFVEQLPRGK